jgi:hypothetical protein
MIKLLFTFVSEIITFIELVLPVVLDFIPH